MILPPTELLNGRQANSTAMRYLRELAKREEGKHPTTEDRDLSRRLMRRNAEHWEEKILASGRIADILPNGRVEVVYATADEKDADGRTKWIARWLKPGRQNPST